MKVKAWCVWDSRFPDFRHTINATTRASVARVGEGGVGMKFQPAELLATTELALTVDERRAIDDFLEVLDLPVFDHQLAYSMAWDAIVMLCESLAEARGGKKVQGLNE